MVREGSLYDVPRVWQRKENKAGAVGLEFFPLGSVSVRCPFRRKVGVPI